MELGRALKAVHDVESGAPDFGCDAGSLQGSVLLDSKKNSGGDPPSRAATVQQNSRVLDPARQL
jgi:hypothetical protein